MPPESDATRIGLTRHAPTVWNRDKRIQGQQDSRLTAAGRKRSESWGQVLSCLPWNRILSSDLGRAVETAELINSTLGLPLSRTPLLREMDWGAWTGRSIQDIKAENPGLLKQVEKAGWSFCPPGGEDRLAVWQRAREALLRAAEEWPRQAILVVTHEGLIKCLIYRLLGRRFLPDEAPVLKPEHVHILAADSQGLRLESLNAISLAGPAHLQGDTSEPVDTAS